MTIAFYNENDPKAAAWLRELIAEGHVVPGVVDTRDIRHLKGDELAGFTQVHLFAGIGGWSHALRLAGWPDDRPVWTGYCPCQPFSSAGKQKGTKDARHLWPWMRHLLFRCRPPVAFGEQVASGLGRQWLAGVRANLEALDYVVGAADLCAAGVSAPHIRQRLYWVADARHWPARIVAHVSRASGQNEDPAPRQGDGDAAGDRGTTGRLPDARRVGRRSRGGPWGGVEAAERGEPSFNIEPHGSAGRLGDAHGAGLGERLQRDGDTAPHPSNGSSRGPDVDGSSAGAGFWSAFDVLPFRDGKARRVEPGTFPLAHGVSGRVGLLRGYGNAIVPQVAATFIRAALGREAAHV